MIVLDQQKKNPSRIVLDDQPDAVPSSSREIAPKLRDYFSGKASTPGDRAAVGVSKGIASIPAAFWNQYLLNTPRAITEHYGKEEYPAPGLMDKIKVDDEPIPFEPAFGAASKVAGLAGATASLPGRAIMKLFGASPKIGQVASKIPYWKKAATAGLAGAAYSPEDPLDVKSRAFAGGASALIAPPVERVVSGLGKLFPRALRRVALGEGSSKVIKKVREIGAENVLNSEKEAPDYLTKNLRPQVESMVKGSAKTMNPKTLKELGMDQETIDFLTSLKPHEIQETRYAGHLGDVVSDIKRELGNAVNFAKRDYSDTIKKIPLKARLQPGGYQQGLSDALEGMFAPNKKGFRKDLQEATTHSRKPFMALYSQLRKQLKGYGSGQGIDKTQYVLLHDHLIKLQQSPDGYISRTATMLKEAIEQDAQKFGFGDIAGIKERYKTGKEFEPFLAKTNLNSKQLARELTPEQEATFRSLEKYLGKDFISKAKKINALREYDELIGGLDTDKTKLSNKISALLRESQGENRAEKIEELGRVVGSPEKGATISKSVLANRLAQQFGEKGTYPSKAGLIRSGARGLLKKSEEMRPPIAKKGSEIKNALKQLFYGENKTLKATGAAAGKKMKDEGGYIRFGGKHADLYEYDPLKPAAMKRDGKIIDKWVYDPSTKTIYPVQDGLNHTSGIPGNSKAPFDTFLRGINKGKVTIFRPSGAETGLVQSAALGDIRSWEKIRAAQVDVARQLYRNDPGRKIILASGGYDTQIPMYEGAHDIPENAVKLANPRYVYTVPQLTPEERRVGSAFTKAIDPEIGGVTFRPDSESQPKSGYGVAIDKKYEIKKPKTDFEPQDIHDYYEKFDHVLSKKGNYLGIWEDDGIIYLDITTVEPDKAVAERLGQNRQQLGIYGFKERKTFRIGERRASNISGKIKKGSFGSSGKDKGLKGVQAASETGAGLKEKVKKFLQTKT